MTSEVKDLSIIRSVGSDPFKCLEFEWEIFVVYFPISGKRLCVWVGPFG